MSQKTLEHGQIVGLRCPYCKVVAQPLAPGGGGNQDPDELGQGVLGGLKSHMLVVHSELYEAWVLTFK